MDGTRDASRSDLAPRRDADRRRLEIELLEPDELFQARRSDVSGGLPPIEPGIDRLRDALGAAPHRRPPAVVILLPPDLAGPHVQQGIRQAIGGYCEMGIRRAEQELRANQREGWRALGLGCVMLGVFLALSEVALHSALPAGLRDFFGNGLFVVAAWVGMWYPLDTLIYSGRPHRVERRLLETLRRLEIVVVAREPL